LPLPFTSTLGTFTGKGLEPTIRGSPIKGFTLSLAPLGLTWWMAVANTRLFWFGNDYGCKKFNCTAPSNVLLFEQFNSYSLNLTKVAKARGLLSLFHVAFGQPTFLRNGKANRIGPYPHVLWRGHCTC